MNIILDRFIPLHEDESIIDVIEYYMKEYSVKRGYRLDFSLSRQFVHVTVLETLKENNMELTKLQRIGISHLMVEIKKHNPFLNNGRIIFVNSQNGEFTNMFIRENKTTFEFMITLSKEELINDNIQYEYLYDSLNDIFRITAVEERMKINGVC